LQESKAFKCSVCGYIYKGNEPPEKCPQCSSSSKEYSELKEKRKLKFDGEKFDILLINGSSHRRHNTGVLTDLVEKTFKRKGVSYRRFNLNELDIQHCWCCYSMRDSACTFPCRNQLDDAPALHEMVINSRAVAGQGFVVSWRVNNPTQVNISHTAIHYGPESKFEPLTLNSYPSLTTPKNGTIPADFSTNMLINAIGITYFRAHAIIDGNNYGLPK